MADDADLANCVTDQATLGAPDKLASELIERMMNSGCIRIAGLVNGREMFEFLDRTGPYGPLSEAVEGFYKGSRTGKQVDKTSQKYEFEWLRAYLKGRIQQEASRLLQLIGDRRIAAKGIPSHRGEDQLSREFSRVTITPSMALQLNTGHLSQGDGDEWVWRDVVLQEDSTSPIARGRPGPKPLNTAKEKIVKEIQKGTFTEDAIKNKAVKIEHIKATCGIKSNSELYKALRELGLKK